MRNTLHESVPPSGEVPCFEEGHLTESALVALGDGQDFLPDAADAHLAACDECARRLVQFSMASVDAGDALRGMSSVPTLASEGAALAAVPWRAIVTALAVSLASLAPSLVRLPTLAVHAAPGLARAVPVLLHGIIATLCGRGPGVTAATLVSSVLLVLVGVAVSRSARHTGVPS